MATATALAGAWSTLPTTLTPWILDVIHSMGHTRMTPVQSSAIPLFMQNKDVVVEAVTGSGKTLAFVIPILERLIRRESKLGKNEIGALVISPTRELASQIHSIFSFFLASQPSARHSPSSSSVSLQGDCSSNSDAWQYPPPLLLVSSESSPAQDLQNFLSQGSDIVIGTPGRMEEFLLGKGRNLVSVKELEVLVLDEADRLLDLGFQQTLTCILTHLPKQRRTGLFSATMTDADAISELVRVGLRNPARIIVKVQTKKTKGKVKSAGDGIRTGRDLIEERRIPANLSNYCLQCRASEKLLQLVRLIRFEATQEQSARFIVYFATCACVDYFYRVLPSLLQCNATLYSLHGHLPPAARTRTLEAFTSAVATPVAPCILLATDVAARGLDLPDVDVVLQFDPPSDPKAFSHRCGRTARAGRAGRAWVLLVGREVDYVDFMAVRKIPLKERRPLDEHNSPISEKEQPEDAEVLRMLQTIRGLVLTDRALYDKAAKAYVSFVRAYSKHEASYIFRIKGLDLIGVAKSFGLLRLPHMPELKDIDRSHWEDAKVDWATYAYLDKAQEAKRLIEAQKPKLDPEDMQKRRQKRTEHKKVNAAWSQQNTRKEERERRREKNQRKKEWEKAQKQIAAVSDQSTKRPLPAVSDSAEDEDDWEDLAKEERMAKKVKRGDLSQRDFDLEFADL